MSDTHSGTRPLTDEDVGFYVELPAYVKDTDGAEAWLSKLADVLSANDVTVVPDRDRSETPFAAAGGTWFAIHAGNRPICPGRVLSPEEEEEEGTEEDDDEGV